MVANCPSFVDGPLSPRHHRVHLQSALATAIVTRLLLIPCHLAIFADDHQ